MDKKTTPPQNTPLIKILLVPGKCIIVPDTIWNELPEIKHRELQTIAYAMIKPSDPQNPLVIISETIFNMLLNYMAIVKI